MLTVFIGVTKSQVQISFGPGAGFNYAVHSIENDEPFSKVNPLVTGQLDMQFSRRFALLIWMDFYSDMSAKTLDTDEEVKITYLHLSPTLKYCIPGSRFYLFAGPGIGIKTKGIIKDLDYDMEEDIPRMKMRNESRFGAGYEFYLSNKLTLTPFATFNAGMNSVVSDFDWQLTAMQFGLVLRYNAY
jgi:hypothetical protein